MSSTTNVPDDAAVAAAGPVDLPVANSSRIARAPLLALIGRSLRFGRTRIALVMLASVIVVALLGPDLAPKAPNGFVAEPFHPPLSGAPFGTDSLGRDVLSRFLAGGRLILGVAAAATALGAIAGALIGITAAYAKSALDDVLMRLNDVILAFPMIVFALLVVSTVGTKPWLLIVTVAVSTAPRVARVARSAALEIVDREFVKASELFGERRLAIFARDVLPNIASPLLVEASLRLTYSIAVVAALGFLGFGIQPPNPDWGLMIKENQSALAVQPWPVVLPIAAIAILTIGMNLFADGLSRALIGIERKDRNAP